jgi:hypothetical protein
MGVLAGSRKNEIFHFSSASRDLHASRACAEHYSKTRHFRCCYLNTLLTAATSAYQLAVSNMTPLD